MAALSVIGVILLFLLFLALLRVGAVVTFDEDLCVTLRIGPFRKTIIPAKEKASKVKKEQGAEKAGSAGAEEKKKRALPKLSKAEWKDLAATLFAALKKTAKRACRHVRIDPLEVFVTVGGSDPAEIAQRYGYLNAAMWSLMPRAEALFQIPHPSLHLRMDYEAEKSCAKGRIGVRVCIGALLVIAAALAVPLLRWLRRFQKQHKNDPPVPLSAEQTNDTGPEKQPA